jgi:hypothetical protein
MTWSLLIIKSDVPSRDLIRWNPVSKSSFAVSNYIVEMDSPKFDILANPEPRLLTPRTVVVRASFLGWKFVETVAGAERRLRFRIFCFVTNSGKSFWRQETGFNQTLPLRCHRDWPAVSSAIRRKFRGKVLLLRILSIYKILKTTLFYSKCRKSPFAAVWFISDISLVKYNI